MGRLSMRLSRFLLPASIVWATAVLTSCDSGPSFPTPVADLTPIVVVPTVALVPPTSGPTSTPNATQTALAQLIDPILAQLTNAAEIHIKDEWSGRPSKDFEMGQFSHQIGTIDNTWPDDFPVSALSAHISLTRTGDLFTGSGYYAAGTTPEITRTETITVSVEAVEDFLSKLSISPVEAKPYVPFQDRTREESNPSISVEVRLAGQAVHYHTKSQGYLHRPWAVDIDGDTYNIDSTQPNFALQEFERYIHVNDVMEDLIRQSGVGKLYP